ncbi:MAG: hypothetical protein M1338_04780 [Patescibacteria group bacterium]|nr:hypothetical protein [Patescibacteria group bacterium]
MGIEKYLKSIGLNDKEINIYLICLELGESTIVPIVKKANVPRTTVYHILERLREYELVEILDNMSRRIYIPYPPEKISNILIRERNNINEKINEYKKLLPEFEQKYHMSVYEPKVKFFKGEEIKLIYEEILNSKAKEVLYVSEVRQIENVLGRKYLHDWINRRIKKSIWSKCIWVKTEEVMGIANYKPGKDNLRVVRYAPKGFNSPAQIMVYSNIVVTITTAKEDIGVTVTSNDYAETMRSWFNELWKVSSKS